ncbi:hypothetical protein VP01_1420g2 [Puccinia sorghi]|uniref:Uncharacterized protein n=1 Tax=Puccinia sorghi TaxID=27349 RepID=A0A0L6VKN1_9BASI|nr:hypothetical protein VP01_1420g2 [Puccinia sorghi]
MEEENFKNLFGSGSKTKLVPGLMTWVQAYKKFAKYMNHLAPGLNLAGNQMCQHLDTYKNKYQREMFLQDTGAGLKNRKDIIPCKNIWSIFVPALSAWTAYLKIRQTLLQWLVLT